jgi:hypothetical protein
MPTWWKFGFVGSLIVMASAFTVHVALDKPKVVGSHQIVSFGDEAIQTLSWGWGPDEISCKEFDSCLSIEVHDTDSCEQQLEITFDLTDEHDNLIASEKMVIESPEKSEPTLIEIGVNRNDFEYFVMRDVMCTSAPLTDTEDL